MKNNQKGFSSLLGLLLFIVLAGGGLYLYSEKVSREIPEINSVSTTTQKKIKEVAKEVATEKPKTDDWKTYSNEQYGFEFKYPSDLVVRELGSSGIGVDGKEIIIDEDYTWVTLKQIKELILENAMVNPHLRSLVSFL
jgi:hypothetical protein